MNQSKLRFSGWRCFVGLYLGMSASMGSWLSYTLMIPTYMEEFQVNMTMVSLMNIFAMIMSTCLNMFLFDKLFRKLGPRRCYIFGGLLVMLIFFMYAHSHHIVFSIFTCFLHGIPIAICQNATGASTVSMWFKKKMDVMTSILLSSLTAGPMIFLNLCARLIQSNGWRSGLQILGLLAGGIMLLSGLFLVRDEPAKYGQRRYGEEENAVEGQTAVSVDAAPVDAAKVKRSPAYILLFISVLCIAMFSCLFAMSAPTFFQALEMDLVEIANYTTIYNAISLVIMFVAGFVIEKLGFQRFIIFTMFAGYLCFLILAFAVTGSTKIGIMILVCLLAAICVSGGTLVTSLSIAPTFGVEFVSKLVGGLMAAFNIGTAIVPTTFSVIVDAFGYRASWLVHMAIGVIGLLVFCVATRKKEG